MAATKDQKLLSKLYECQEIILDICNDKKDNKYIIISELISYLENKIIIDKGFVGM